MERTLLIIKPDATERRLTGEILRRVETAHFRIAQLKLVDLGVEDAREFYAIHRGKPFFDGLVEYMSSGAAVVAVLEKDNAVIDLRTLVGATDPTEAPLGTIRHDFGLDVKRNSVHASDALDTAETEIGFFFPGL